MSDSRGDTIDTQGDGAGDGVVVPDDGETSMVQTGDEAAHAAPVDVGEDPGPTEPSWWRRRGNLVVLGLVAVAAAAAVVVATSRTSAAAPADFQTAGYTVPSAPARAVDHRWTLELTPGDGVALVDDRVVVVEDPISADAEGIPVTARHVRSRAVVWDTRLDRAALVLLVDGDGVSTTVQETWTDPGDGTQPLVALSADDGRLLWERDVLGDMGASAGHVLLATLTGCELVDARSGRTTWEVPDVNGGSCVWSDEDEIAAGNADGAAGPEDVEWTTYGMDGAATAEPIASLLPPTMVGEDLAVLEGQDLVVRSRSGEERWRVDTTGMGLEDGSARPRDLPGQGVLLTGWDEQTGNGRAVAFDLQGNPLDVGLDTLDGAFFFELDGSTFALQRGWEDELMSFSVRAADDLGTERAGLAFGDNSLPGDTVTTRGVLAPGPDGDHIDLRTWPDLATGWSLPLPADVDLSETSVDVLTSDAGVVVIPTSPRVLHAYG